MEMAELEENERGAGAGALHRGGPLVGFLWGQARDGRPSTGFQSKLWRE